MADSGNTNLSIENVINLKEQIQELIDNNTFLNNKTTRKIKEIIQLYDENFDKKKEDLEEILRTNEHMRLLFNNMGDEFQKQVEFLTKIDGSVGNIAENLGVEKETVQKILPLYEEWLEYLKQKNNLKSRESDLNAEEREQYEQIKKIR